MEPCNKRSSWGPNQRKHSVFWSFLIFKVYKLEVICTGNILRKLYLCWTLNVLWGTLNQSVNASKVKQDLLTNTTLIITEHQPGAPLAVTAYSNDYSTLTQTWRTAHWSPGSAPWWGRTHRTALPSWSAHHSRTCSGLEKPATFSSLSSSWSVWFPWTRSYDGCRSDCTDIPCSHRVQDACLGSCVHLSKRLIENSRKPERLHAEASCGKASLLMNRWRTCMRYQSQRDAIVRLFVHITFRMMNYSSGLMPPINNYFLNSLMEIQETGEKNLTPMLWSKSSINPACWFLSAAWGGKQVLDGEVPVCISCICIAAKWRDVRVYPCRDFTAVYSRSGKHPRPSSVLLHPLSDLRLPACLLGLL